MSTNNNIFEGFKESKTFDQLGILVLDGSGSMSAPGKGNQTLGQMVNFAVKDFVTWFQRHSTIKHNISIAIVKFDDHSEIVLPISELVGLVTANNWDPTVGMEGGTNLAIALETAEEIAIAHFDNENKLEKSVVIVVLSDGITIDPEYAIEVANRLKSNPCITLACSYFQNPHPELAAEAPKAQKVLMEIASEDPDKGKKRFENTHTIESLREFFISSVSARKKGNTQCKPSSNGFKDGFTQ